MKFKLSAKIFTQALAQVAKTIPRKAAMPSLKYVRIEAKHDRLILITTNLEISTIKQLDGNDVQVQKEGVILVNHAVLINLMRAIKDYDVTCEIIEVMSEVKRFKIKLFNDGIDAEYFIETGDPEGYPELPTLASIEKEARVKFNLRGEDLFAMGNVLLSSITRDTTRPTLTGMLIEPEVIGNAKKNTQTTGIVMVATDGHRLALLTLTQHSAVTWTPSSKELHSNLCSRIIPGDVFEFLTARQVKDAIAYICIGDTRGILNLEESNLKYVFRLIEGNFPKCKSVIPDKKDQKQEVWWDTVNTLEVLARTEIVADNLSRQVTVTLYPEKKQVILEATETENRFSGYEVLQGGQNAIKTENSVPFKIAFNIHYFMQILKNVKPGTIESYHGTKDSPSLFFGDSGIEGINLMQLLMPIRMS